EAEGKELVADEMPGLARIAAVGALEAQWDDGVRDVLLRLLRDPAPAVRRLATEALARNLKPGDRAPTETLLQQLEAPDPGQRRSVFLALGRLGGVEAADGLVNTLKFDEGKDVFLMDGLLHGIDRAGKPGVAKLIALAESGDEKDHDRVLEAFLGLSSPAAAE